MSSYDSGLRQCTIAELHPLPPAAVMRPVGAACAFNSQCRSGACSADVAAGGCGVCLDARPLGARCDGPMQGCSASAVCDQGICKTQKKGPGDACALQPKGGDAGECDDDLYCNGKPGDMTGLCAARLPPGSDCTYYGVPCAHGESCDGKRCWPWQLPAKLGEACLGRMCESGLFCSAGGVCATPTLPRGAPCGVRDGKGIEGGCVPGTVCGDPRYPNGGGGGDTKSICLDLPGQCAPCNLRACAPGLFCMEPDPTSTGVYLPICEHLHREGESCSTSFWWNIDCAPDLECRKGVCVPACK